MKRRDFLHSMALVSAAMFLPVRCTFGKSDKLGKMLPTRKLGNTGENVTILGVGGWHVGDTSMKDAEEIIETAIDEGIRFFDTAHAYGGGESETRYGKLLTPKYRDDIFLMTKSGAQDYDSARKELELSLKRLKTDTVDLWQIHSLESPEDAENRVKNGVLRLAEDALKEGKIKYIGFTGHSDPNALTKMMDLAENRGILSATMCPVNPVDALDNESNIEKVIPKAIDNNIGVIAMKTLAAGRIMGKQFWGEKLAWESDAPIVPNHITLEELFHFVWSLPVSTLVTGALTANELREKIAFVKTIVNMDESQRTSLIDKVSTALKLDEIEYYKKV